jgi:hypothetical protein
VTAVCAVRVSKVGWRRASVSRSISARRLVELYSACRFVSLIVRLFVSFHPSNVSPFGPCVRLVPKWAKKASGRAGVGAFGSNMLIARLNAILTT